MKQGIAHCCEQMRAALSSGETGLAYVPKFREYGIKVLDGGSSYIEISHCPWCGCALPASLRDRWFAELEALGLDFPKDEIPAEFTDDRWYRNLGLG